MNDRGGGRWIVLALALAAAACGHREQRVVDQYFGAVNAQDNQTLSSFALVGFDQKVDKWTITQEFPEQREPAPLPDLAKKQKAAGQAVADNKKAAGAYSLEHLTDVDQVRELLKRSGAKIPPKLQPIADQWEKFGKQDRELKKALAEAKDAFEKEKKNATLSVGAVEDVESLAGEMVSKQLELALTIGGQSQAYVMTLRKYEMASGGQGPRVMSRWVVASLAPKS